MRTLFSATVLLVALSLPVSGQIMEMNGSWELPPHKSSGPSPAQETLVFDISKGIQRYTMTARNEDGSNSLNQWEIQYDGKDHPTRTPGNTASVRRLGEKTEFVVNKSSGDITSTYTRVLVADDRTIMSVGRNADGDILWVRVFEKKQ